MKGDVRAPILVIGNGGAAVHAIKAAREAGFQGEIHQVSDTQGAAFNPMLAPYYLKGILSWRQCFPFGIDFYKKYNVTCHHGSPVTRLDTINKTVATADQKKFSYDKCLIASGACAMVPPVPGLRESQHAFVLRTADSTTRIQNAMSSARKVIILGASLVGVKIAEILSNRGAEVILIDVASQMLPHGAHPRTASLLKTHFEQHGIEIRIGCGLQGMDESSKAVCCFFPNNIAEEADFVVVCTGIRPNLQFVDPEQIKIDQAVVVNNEMRTSAADVYAAGDACQGLNLLTEKREWLGTWGNACYQGRTAGLNMAGMAASYEGMLPQHVSPLFDWIYVQVGDVCRQEGQVRIDVSGDPFSADGFRLLAYADDILVGANLINASAELGSIKKAIAQKRPWRSGEPVLKLPI